MILISRTMTETSSRIRNWSLVASRPPSWNSETFHPPPNWVPVQCWLEGWGRIHFICHLTGAHAPAPHKYHINHSDNYQLQSRYSADVSYLTPWAHGTTTLMPKSPMKKLKLWGGHRALTDLEFKCRHVWLNILKQYPTLLHSSKSIIMEHLLSQAQSYT